MKANSGARRSLLPVFLALAFAVLLVPAGATPAPAREAKLTKVTIAALPIEATAQAFYAKHRGFFRKQGIDATLKVFTEPGLTVPAVTSGQAQFASIPVGTLALLKSQGAPVRGVAAGSIWEPKAPTVALVAARRVNLRRPGDIVGLRVVVDRVNSIAHVALLKWLKRNGLSDKDIRLSSLAFPDILAALGRGVVDVGVLPEPLLTQAKQRGLRPIAYPLNAVCPRDCLTTMWMARRDVDPNLAARFRNAIQAASIWANQDRNKAASGAILGRYARTDRPVIRRMTRTSFAKRLRPVEGQPWIDVFAEFGLIPGTFQAIELVK
jgi:NitT/TauT family transport system substrate-binding protein